jgi:hypothetical protein
MFAMAGKNRADTLIAQSGFGDRNIVKQGKPSIADADPSLFLDQLKKLHGDFRAVGEKAINCVPPPKIQAKATDFLRGLQDASVVSLRAVDALGYAIDVLLFAPSLSGHTAIDRAISSGKIDDAEMEAAHLLGQATFHLFEITEDRGDGFLAATDLRSTFAYVAWRTVGAAHLSLPGRACDRWPRNAA